MNLAHDQRTPEPDLPQDLLGFAEAARSTRILIELDLNLKREELIEILSESKNERDRILFSARNTNLTIWNQCDLIAPYLAHRSFLEVLCNRFKEYTELEEMHRQFMEDEKKSGGLVKKLEAEIKSIVSSKKMG